jgi:hypothetical protein
VPALWPAPAMAAGHPAAGAVASRHPGRGHRRTPSLASIYRALAAYEKAQAYPDVVEQAHAPDYFARLVHGAGMVIDCRPAVKPGRTDQQRSATCWALPNLDLGTRAGAEGSDQNKYLSERVPATLVLAGVDLEGNGLFAGR